MRIMSFHLILQSQKFEKKREKKRKKSEKLDQTLVSSEQVVSYSAAHSTGSGIFKYCYKLSTA